MSSTPQKSAPKMCKSPKNLNFPQAKLDKIHIINEYENLSTNCTMIGSNNLHLVKKPQMVTNMSPVYSNPSPGYPPSPYSSPASLKSPSPQSFKPPTPQPSFPVMQIIHSSHQLLARPIQATPQNVIKLKPHLNILPKPSASPQPSPKPSVSPHIVIPSQQTATIMPTAPPLLLNQMQMLAPSVQLILRPQTTKMPTHVQTATPQGLILQPSGQQLLQIQSPRTAQPMMRVLTNGMHLAPHTQVVTQVASPVITQQTQIMANEQHNLSFTQAHINSNSPPKKKPKKKKQKLDLANIMKLSGIGDEDDIQFESDTSQSESEPTTMQIHHHHSDANILRPQHMDPNKRISNIQITSVPQPTGTPLMQLLNQSFQSGVNSTSFQTTQAAPAGIPLNSFIAPNITINNGLVVQRNGGFKLALGEDGRLVLQHDPTLNQDLQSQLLLQSIFGLNGLVLQPSLDQQVHSQTVQTIQQQSVQTIQQQTVQSQTIQTVQQQTVQPHSLQTIQQTIQPQIQAVQPQTVQQTVQQTIQHQTVQSQPLAHTQPMQIVQPQPIHTIQSHNIQQHTIQSQPTVQAMQSQVHQSIQSQIQSLLQSQTIQPTQPMQPIHTQAPTPTIHTQTMQPTQPILKVQPFQKTQPPVQTVHPQPVQTIHHHPPQPNLNENQQNHPPQTSYVVNLTPEQLELLKRNGQLTVNGQTIFMQRPNITNKQPPPETTNHQHENKLKLSPKIKPVVKKLKPVKTLQENLGIKNVNHISEKVNHVVPKETTKSSLVMALQSPAKSQQKIIPQPPSATVQPTVQSTVSSQTQTPKQPVQAKVQGTQTTSHTVQTDGDGVDNVLGRMLVEDSTNISTVSTSTTSTTTTNQGQQQQQRIHTIQLTPQQQQHLKSIQLQIQTLSARLTPSDTEMHTALKLLFAEQQKILASGKLLPPDKVIYQNNQLTIINPSSLGIGNAPAPVVKTEPQVIQTPRASCNEPNNNQPVVPMNQSTPKITISLPEVKPSTSAPVIKPSVPAPLISTSQTQQNKFIPSFTKAQLLEQQLNTDQNGAIKPDVHTPFRDKADACKRLIRYHCYNQPVLSQKDLNKADEIFELTARHFIDKFSRMVDKYRYLLLKESMRQVQTSELMMLDRMFLAEEQQSLMRLRHELEEGPPPDMLQQMGGSNASGGSMDQTQEEYDEWACIQRELGCLQPSIEEMRLQQHRGQSQQSQQSSCQSKRSASSDSRLETLKKFRVDKHSKRHGDCYGGQNNFVGGSGGASNHFNVVNSIKTPNLLHQKSQSFSIQSSSNANGSMRQQMHHGTRGVQYTAVGGVYHSTNITQQQYTQQFSHMQDIHQNIYGMQAQQHGAPPYNLNCSSVHNSVNIKGNVQSHGSQSSEGESGNNSIDEHVQSAIDSILNLQQNSNLDLDEAVSSILS